MKKLLFTLSLLSLLSHLLAQTGNVGIGTMSPDPSAALDITSTDKGLLIPTVDTAAIMAPIANGLMVFQPTDNTFYYYKLDHWEKLGAQVDLVDADGDTKISLDEGARDSINFNIDGTQYLKMVTSPAGTDMYGFPAPGTFRLDLPNNGDNIGLGEGALSNNLIDYSVPLGISNIAIGTSALANNVGGSDNVATGFKALTTNVFGFFNIATGSHALFRNESGNLNVATGNRALLRNESGSYNVATGGYALLDNKIGSYNVAIGYRAGGSETSSHKLYIESSSTSQDSTTSLIYGEFDKDSLRFNAAVNINGNYILPTTGGTAGQVITANADGTTEWSAAASTFETFNGLVRNTGDHATEDFVFGSDELPQNGATTSDTLMFFDKSKGAFRAGGLYFSDAWSPDSIGVQSFASGYNTKAIGLRSTAMGNSTEASGFASTAMGDQTEASETASIAMGNNTEASGIASTAMGNNTEASGFASTAMGNTTKASGIASTAMGRFTEASGVASTAMGTNTEASAYGETALGAYNTIDNAASSTSWVSTDRLFTVGNGPNSSNRSDAMIVYKNGNVRLYDSLHIGADGSEYSLPGARGIDGQVLKANADGTTEWSAAASTFETVNGLVRNTGDHATEDFVFGSDELPQNGVSTSDTLFFFDKDKGAFRIGRVFESSNWSPDSMGMQSFATGYNTKAIGETSTATGFHTKASGYVSTALGQGSEASGFVSTALGQGTLASGFLSTAMGTNTEATGYGSTAMGELTLASGDGSTAMGKSTLASGDGSTAMGEFTEATGYFSTAMGGNTTALGYYATAMGTGTLASGDGSTAMGGNTTASGYYATAMGTGTLALGYYATAMGRGTEANALAETALGSYNTIDNDANPTDWVLTDRLFTIGNGEFNSLSDAMIIYKNGNVRLYDSLHIGADGSEYSLPTNRGGVGEVLRTDGNGNTTWADPIIDLDLGLSNSELSMINNTTGSSISVDLSSLSTSTFETVNGLVRNTGDHATEDFVFGSDELPQNGVSTTDTLFFFDKDKGAFRIGQVFESSNWSPDSIGLSSFASGTSTKAIGATSTAMGFRTEAIGAASTAMGYHSNASGFSSTAMGGFTKASGNYSIAMGHYTEANAFNETALGAYNTIDNAASSGSWVSTDRLFTVGNGTGNGNRSDAMIVYKNGNVRLYDSLHIGMDGSEYSLPVAKGIAGQVLIANADGTTSWVDMPPTDLIEDLDGDTKIKMGEHIRRDSINFELDGFLRFSFLQGNDAIGVDRGTPRIEMIDGRNNIAMGKEAMANNGLGEDNIAIGRDALGDLNGQFGDGNDGSGEDNVAIGHYALSKTDQLGNVAIGNFALENTTGSRNVAIGYRAGENETGGNKLYIENSSADSTSALIYGEFDNDILRVNGTLQVNDPAGANGYALPSNRGLSGQFLKTNADGTTEWEAVSGGSGSFETVNGLVRNTGNHATEDFVFGSDELPQNGVTTTGTLFFFDKDRGAFRVGGLSSSTNWAQDSIGTYSFASGYNTRASGDGATAIGQGTVASGLRSTAMGVGTQASGESSTAIGQNTIASGFRSTAMGSHSVASQFAAIAMGDFTTASGLRSTAMGHGTEASGRASTAMGKNTEASGENATAIGFETDADAFNEVVVGSCNTIDNTASSTSWVSTDRLFTVGNGQNSSNRSNAIVVLKNGNMSVGNSIPSHRLTVTSEEHGANGGIKLISPLSTNNWVMNTYSTTNQDLGFFYNGVTRGYLNYDINVANIDFTAQHRNIPAAGRSTDYTDKIGMIVSSSGEIYNLDGSTTPKISESLPHVQLSEKPYDKSIYGVIAGIEDPDNEKDAKARSYPQGMFSTTIARVDEDDYRLIINSGGEGAVWVSNYNGNVENGDLVVTAPIAGIGMRQDDDIIRSHTVAKIVMDCDFDLNSDRYECKEVRHEGKTYRMALLACVYKCN